MMRKASYLVIGLLLLRVEAVSQMGYLWSFDELTAQSEVVVIATPGATQDTGIKTELDDLQPPLPVVELHTEFKVLSLLKGNVSSGTLLLRHYRLDTDRIRGGCLNCGSQLDFATTGRMAVSCRSGDVSAQLPTPCNYVLFLKRGTMGVFVPTSGQVFPGDSVLLLRRAG
jgi:hypothetical protein